MAVRVAAGYVSAVAEEIERRTMELVLLNSLLWGVAPG